MSSTRNESNASGIRPSGKVAITVIERQRQHPTYEVLRELCDAAVEARVHGTAAFKKLVAYVLEKADGRDRREPWTTRQNDARPVPKLRLLVEDVFGIYGDLHWFKINKIANTSKHTLKGLYPRMAAGMWRLPPEHFGELIEALIAEKPDAALLAFLNERGPRLPGLGVEVFSRFACAMRRDQYFVIPKEWGTNSGCLDYVGGDLRRYLALCRNFREVCRELDVPEDVRGGVLEALLSEAVPPAKLLEALHRAVGPEFAKHRTIDPADAFVPQEGHDEDEVTLPLDFATRMIKARRGRTDLRKQLLKAYDNRCAMTGACVTDLLEVAYVMPYPDGDVHSTSNTMPLRSDLHTLWDLNLLGVDPESNRIAVAPALAETSYARLAGRPLVMRRDDTAIAEVALRERWRIFSSAHPRAQGEKVEPSVRTDPGASGAFVRETGKTLGQA